MTNTDAPMTPPAETESQARATAAASKRHSKERQFKRLSEVLSDLPAEQRAYAYDSFYEQVNKRRLRAVRLNVEFDHAGKKVNDELIQVNQPFQQWSEGLNIGYLLTQIESNSDNVAFDEEAAIKHFDTISSRRGKPKAGGTPAKRPVSPGKKK